MKQHYKNIIHAKQKGKKLLAVLIDPEKMPIEKIASFFDKVHTSIITHVFVGGSTDENHEIASVVKEIKKHSQLPVFLFPGSYEQITALADGILFLSLLSGRNPEYLITQQVQAVSKLKNTKLEIIPTGYILIDGGVETAVQRVSNTQPISQENIHEIVDTAIAGEYMGKKLIYLEAGSGAKKSVATEIVKKTATQLNISLIVGGGIRSRVQLDEVFKAGADMAVIGTAFEEDESFFEELRKTNIEV